MNKKNNPECELDFLSGGGKTGTLIRSMDWSRTPLGPLSTWPQSLKTAGSICLNSRYPMFIAWGAHRSMLYNDSYTAVLADKHPWALGRPAHEVWAEIWDILGQHWSRVFKHGEATWAEDLLLVMNRSGFDEETYFTFSYSPIRGEGGTVDGMFCACQETTEKVVSERRLKTLRELAAQAALAKRPEMAVDMSMKTLSGNPSDMPFALLYLLEGDGSSAFLAGAAGFKAKGQAGPSRIDLSSEDSHGWPLELVLREGSARVIESLPARLNPLPTGLWKQPASRALLLPIQFAAHEKASGVLVAGVSPVRPLDEGYRTFFEVAAGQIASAVANARAYQEERKRSEALAEIDRAKTIFFSNVSHEFRTPLTLMLGPVEDLLATSHIGLSPAAKGQLEVVNRNGLRLLRLVNTLLDFSRIEAGRVQAVFEPTDLAAFTTELASVFRAATERAGLRLSVHCPKLSEPVYVDRDMWEKVVLNLISNAFKFTLEGEIEVKLRVESGEGRVVPRFAVLTVRDTGVGIPAEEMPRIFDRFHRVQNMRSRTHEGSGIGLALVQELIKLHGGTVRAESRLNEGTTFIVTVPLGKDHLPPDRIGATRNLASTAVGAAPFVEEALRWLPEQSAIDAIEPAPTDDLLPVPCPPYEPDENRPRIIVADDNADMRRYLARILSERYNVQAVPDGQAALAAARERCPDLILSDVMMPNLDGFGLVREIRADDALKAIPLILLSARAGEESRVEGLQQGADDYLIKPFSARELMARVGARLEMARMRKEAGEKIRRSEERFRSLLTNMGDGFVAFDREWRYTHVNPAAAKAFHRAPEELLGKTLWEMWPPVYDLPVGVNFRRALEENTPLNFETYYPAPLDGWFECRCYPMPEGLATFFTEITERKRAEEALRRNEQRYKSLHAELEVRVHERTAELERRNKELQEFAFVASHDLSEPLRKVQTFGDLLKAKCADRLDEQSKDYISRMAGAANRMQELLDALLRYSRVDTKGQEFRPAKLDEVARDAVTDLEVGIQKIEARVEIGPLPTVNGDPSQLRQLFQNLIANSVKYFRSEVTPCIKVSGEVRDGLCQISILDNGIGFDEKYLDKIFQPFQRLHGKNEYPGTGIGLAICKKIVERHGGTITAKSTPGKGSTFIVTLPTKRGE